jgi:hypothetical protein
MVSRETVHDFSSSCVDWIILKNYKSLPCNFIYLVTLSFKIHSPLTTQNSPIFPLVSISYIIVLRLTYLSLLQAHSKTQITCIVLQCRELRLLGRISCHRNNQSQCQNLDRNKNMCLRIVDIICVFLQGWLSIFGASWKIKFWGPCSII